MCAAAAVGCEAITWVSAAPAVAGSRGSGEAFSHVSEASLFGACFEAVQLAKAPGTSFSKACAQAFANAGAQAAPVPGDCAELAGRVSEAANEQFLGDGRLLCGRLIHERALVAGRPLAAFAPTQGSVAAGAFCDVMKVESLAFCVPAAALLVAADAPLVAMTPAPPQATPALRATEVKPSRPAAVQQLQPVAPHQSVVQPAPRLIPEAVSPQMSEAAQMIAGGLFPAFTHQVPQALAAGLPAASPMSAKAEQQPDLNNAGIWSNLAALLHRTG